MTESNGYLGIWKEQVLSTYALMLASWLWPQIEDEASISEKVDEAFESEEAHRVLEDLLSRYMDSLTMEQALTFLSPEDVITPDVLDLMLYRSVQAAIKAYAVQVSVISIVERARVILLRWYRDGPEPGVAYDAYGRAKPLGRQTLEVLKQITLRVISLA